MAKGNCEFKGTGGKYFIAVFLHGIILSAITLGIYTPWAWVRILRLKASHTLTNGKEVSFVGTGGQLFVLSLLNGVLTVITLGIYTPWAICTICTWKAQNTLIKGRPNRFNGTGIELFFLYIIHLFILPILSCGIYYFYGLYKLFVWIQEHTQIGGEKTSFSGDFRPFFGFILLNTLSVCLLYIPLSWPVARLFKWQVEGLMVGDDEEVEHFPSNKTNYIVAVILVLVGLMIGVLAVGLQIYPYYKSTQEVKSLQLPKKQPPTPKPVLPAKIQPDTKTKAGAKPKGQDKAKPAKEKAGPTQEEIDQEYKLKLKTLNNLIELDPENENALYNRAWLHDLEGDLLGAERDYSLVIKINKKKSDAYYNRALVYIKMHNPEQAISDFSEAINLKPDSVDAYCNRGNLYFQQGKLDLALQDYDKALKINPNDIDLYNNRSIIYNAAGEPGKARLDLQKASELGQTTDKDQPVLKQERTTAPELPPVKVAWGMGLNEVKIPESPVSGNIHGADFLVESAKIENSILTIRQGDGFFPDQAIMIFMFLQADEKLEGKTYNVTSKDELEIPHVHLQWKEEGNDVPKTKIFMRDYTMKLEIGIAENNSIPVKIYLSLPVYEYTKTYLAGTVQAVLK